MRKLLMPLLLIAIALLLKTYPIAPESVGTTTQGETNVTSPPVKEATSSALVTRVIDGDTIEIETGEHVRYIGIDTPELAHERESLECYGTEAAHHNELLVLGKRVMLVRDVRDRDTYGRLLRYVFVSETFVNRALVEGGFAYAASYPPDIARQDELRAAERVARTKGRGLWEQCD